MTTTITRCQVSHDISYHARAIRSCVIGRKYDESQRPYNALSNVTCLMRLEHQARVVQRLDSAIHRINCYPVDSAIGFPNTYPLDSDLSDG